jgi:6-phosphogluconolactonase
MQSITTADKAHAILADPSNRFVFVPHTGPNAIFQFTFQPAGKLLSANAFPKLLTPANTGPRHLVFHPKKSIVYVVNEQGSSVTAYTMDSRAGTLRPFQTVSTLPRGFAGSNACAEIKVHPTGKFLYASNRGHDSIACFALDPKDGKLVALEQVATEKTPRSFDLDGTGTILLAAGESSGKVAVYRIARNGKLRRLATQTVGKQPWWVMIVQK